MTLRTYAWFYGKDYELITKHYARQKDHPYYGDEQLYGATEVISFSALHYLRPVTRRTLHSTAKDWSWGKTTVYEKGTRAWDEKFNQGLDLKNEMMVEEYIERPTGWFEIEIPLGFTSIDFFEYLTNLDIFSEMFFVTFAANKYGELTPAFKHTFRSAQLQSFHVTVTDNAPPHHRLRCKIYYATHQLEYFDGVHFNPLSHTYHRAHLPFNEGWLQQAKAAVKSASDHARFLISQASTSVTSAAEKIVSRKRALTLHHISTGSNVQFYGMAVEPGELEDIFFCIAPKKYSPNEFVNNLYKNPTESQRSHLWRMNPHLGNGIEPGQMVFVTADSDAYRKFKPYLEASARRIDVLRRQHPDLDPYFFSEHFALMGSFAESVGRKDNEYYAIANEASDDRTAGMIPAAANTGFEWFRKELKATVDAYEAPGNAHFKEARSVAFKNMDNNTVTMLDTLVRGEKITPNGFLAAMDDMVVGTQRWVATARQLVSLENLYASVQKVNRGLKTAGYLGIGLDGLGTHQNIQEACTVLREDECRAVEYEEWGGFLGGVTAGMAVGIVATAVGTTFTGGWGLVFAIGIAGAGSKPASDLGALGGKTGGRLLHQTFYKKE